MENQPGKPIHRSSTANRSGPIDSSEQLQRDGRIQLQINGLQAATENAKTAENLVQTTEGTLQGISSEVQAMRESQSKTGGNPS